jgi:hypothetical protein
VKWEEIVGGALTELPGMGRLIAIGDIHGGSLDTRPNKRFWIVAIWCALTQGAALVVR